MATIFAMTAGTAAAAGLLDNLKYNFRFGYMVGGTAPVGLPATIRSLDSYKLEPNVTVGIDVNKPLGEHWGVATGLRLENKGMNIKATVKNYHMAFVQKGAYLDGYFTGHNQSEAEEWMITLPVYGYYAFNKNCRVKFGPYISVLTSARFTGYAYDGYLRANTPTGAKIEIGSDEISRGNYDFSDDMRHFQVGLMAGVDYYWGKRWGAFADLTWGVTGIFKSSFHTIEQTMYPLYGSIGLCYRLK